MITPSSGSWPSGAAQRGLEYRDPVEQVRDEADGRVIERESRPQALYPGECGQLTRREPQLPGRAPAGVDDAPPDPPAGQGPVLAGPAGEGAGGQPRGA